MEKYRVITEKFEGPLDLLLHLINKDKLDIYDIPIASITEQYLAYISQMQEFDIKLASEFLLMAAILLQIKSRMLLPKQTVEEVNENDENQNDPRQKLVERLTAYKQFKEVGEILSGLWDQNAYYFVRQPVEFGKPFALPRGLAISNLLSSLAKLITNDEESITYISTDEFYVKDKIEDIMNILRFKNGKLTLRETLTRSGSTNELVTAFLAILELMRTRKIVIDQATQFGDIYICLRETDNVL